MAGVLDDAEISRVLAITAHPDDVDFSAAGTVATQSIIVALMNPRRMRAGSVMIRANAGRRT